MEISPLSRELKASEMPLEVLAANSKLSEDEKLATMSRHFEAILLRQFLNEAHKPLFNSEHSMSGATKAIYQDLMVNQLAEEISKTGSFGLAAAFQSQMTSAPSRSSETGAKEGLRNEG